MTGLEDVKAVLQQQKGIGRMSTDRKTEKQHWDRVWEPAPRMSLPSPLWVPTRNIQRLLDPCLAPGSRFLEIGCAPGKILAWVAKTKRAEVAGLDYSAPGMDNTRRLLNHLGITGDLRCEDIFETTFDRDTFDCVFSCGLIEHFKNPEVLVDLHLSLVKPGGKTIIAIPNYGGIYGHLQRLFDPANLLLHELRIMNPASLLSLVPDSPFNKARAYPFGRLSGALISFGSRLPGWASLGLTVFCNAAGLLQPVDIKTLCPLLVLEITKRH